jgi:single stranded DNA-binding protein
MPMSELKMPYINEVRLAGRLVADPHPLEATGGRPGAAITVASNRYVKGKQPFTTYVDVVCWGDLATAVVTHLAKGSAVLVSGSLAQYEKKQTKGPKLKVLQVSASQIQFLDKPEASPSAEDEETPV